MKLKSLLGVVLFGIINFVCAVDEAFFTSARVGDLKSLQEYLAKGVSVNEKDSKGNSPLIIAAGRGQLAVVEVTNS
jgi:ankyrin repeat protein